DPDRSRSLVQNQGGQDFSRSWAQFESAAAPMFNGDGAGVSVLAAPTSSPSRNRQRQAFESRFPQATWFEWAPVNAQSEGRGMTMAFGAPLRVVPNLEDARVVVAFDADFLNDHPASLRLTREFSAGRKPSAETMNRLWVAEPGMTGTGAMADHRLAVPLGRVASALGAVAFSLVTEHHIEMPEAARGLLDQCSNEGLGGNEAKWVRQAAADLVANPGHGALLVGRRQPAAVHALAAVLNQALGNMNRSVRYVDADIRPSAGIEELVNALNGGQVQNLLILGGNPVFDAPANLDFQQALTKAEHSVHLSLYRDETSKACEWHLPEAHAFESWGDGRAWDGTWTMTQPLIAPLFEGRTAIEVLSLVIGEAEAGYDIVRETFADAGLAGPQAFEKAWRSALHEGVVPGTVPAAVEPRFDAEGLLAAAADWMEATSRPVPTAERPEVVFAVDPKMFDGRFANNGWLQELPEALTTITWDNALLMSPSTARDIGLKDGDLVTVEASGASIELPVYVLPGPARFSMTVWLGHGREAAGKVGNGVGANAYKLRTTENLWSIDGPSVTSTGRHYQLATTQAHWAIDTIGFEARQLRVGQLAREASVDQYLEDPETFRHMDHHPPLVSLWQEKTYEGEQWGMAIDLNACTGCNACVVACQAENNIPVVGREQVLNQREMHWIRLDRYFKTPEDVGPDEVDDAQVAFQPMTCVQCEMAPCEQVCPVAATQHTEDGLNAMVYNRCVGTRYCANNCPFKVRRFNFFNYQKDLAEVSKMQFNPEVTVRSRGVMEKCSFCIQRIQKVRITSGNENRAIADGEITPACGQTCPAQAIHFGNLNDPESAVSASRENPRSYATLAELNIKPRVHYMARLRNPAGHSEQDAGGPPEQGHAAPHGKESA
ncbi:MAG: 4Fe-4S dicluster domain-containing protein, partial [Acidobacteriota bacterium]